MSTRTAVQRPVHLPSSANLQQALLALLGGVVLFGILLIALLVGFNIYYAGRVYPGVSAAGMNLAGLRVEDAQEKLALSLTYPEQGRIVFKEGGNVWIARPEEVGLFLDPKTSALSAYAICEP